MQRKNIPLIALALFSIVILLAQGNIEKAFALTVTKVESDPTSGAMLIVGYSQAQDYLVTAEVTGGVYHIHIVEGDTLTQIADLTTTITTTVSTGTKGIPCTATVCFFAGQVTTTPTIVRISLSTLTIVATYSEAEYAGCTITNYEQFGTAVYATMADLGGCPYTGIYQLSTGFGADGGAGNIQWIEYDSGTSFGDTSHIQGSCLVEGRYFITATTTLVRKYDLSTKTLTSSASLGSTNQEIDCDTTFANGFVYVTRNGATDGVSRVSLSSLAIQGDTGTLTNPQSLMVRGDTVYVVRDDAVNTITAFDKSDLTSSFTFYTAEDDDGHFFKGNSTRFNLVTSGGTDDNIFYRFDGILDTEEEEEQLSPNQEFCSLPENTNILTCRLEAEGNTGLSGSSQLINQSATNIACQVAIIQCTQDEDGNFVPDNPDVKTNGIGYLLVAIAMAIFVGLLWVGSRGNMIEIPTFVWFIGTIAIVGAFTAIEYIDPTFLVITIITVVAFAVAKAKSVFSGSELFKGESF